MAIFKYWAPTPCGGNKKIKECPSYEEKESKKENVTWLDIPDCPGCMMKKEKTMVEIPW